MGVVPPLFQKPCHFVFVRGADAPPLVRIKLIQSENQSKLANASQLSSQKQHQNKESEDKREQQGNHRNVKQEDLENDQKQQILQ